jgi:hypothetical protein
MNKFELHLAYRKETGNNPHQYCIDGHVGRYGDIILSSDEDLKREIHATGCLTIPDNDYIEWLEDKLIDIFKEKS